MDNLTMLVKTFQRPASLSRLLVSARQFYPNLPIIVADDSVSGKCRDENMLICRSLGAGIVSLPDDVGLSAGRNRLVDSAYFGDYMVTMDDDCIFTENTKLELLVAPLIENEAEIVGGAIETLGNRQHYEGHIHWIGTCTPRRLHLVPLVDYAVYSRCDVVYNFFAAKIETLIFHPWDERLKVGEHLDFFINLFAHGVRVAYQPECSIEHIHESPEDYEKWRRRTVPYLSMSRRKWGISRVTGRLRPRSGE